MKSLAPNLAPEDKALMEKLLADGKSVAEAACGVGINRALDGQADRTLADAVSRRDTVHCPVPPQVFQSELCALS
jgi:hypothetical protein